MTKRYLVKIGKLYIKEIELDADYSNTYFITNISLSNEYDPSRYFYKVNEKEKEQIKEILGEVLELANSFDEIDFEEVGK